MAAQRISSPFAGLVLLAVSLAISGCSGISMPSFPSFGSTPEQAPPPPSGGEPSVPSRYTPEELVGRWGFTSYHRDQDRARTEAAARGQCKNPYVIARGPNGGIMMHLADQRQPTELRLKGSASGKQFIGPVGEAGMAEDREIVSFDGRVLITRFVDPDAANRYGNMIYVRCTTGRT
jgi:hypothetical protein